MELFPRDDKLMEFEKDTVDFLKKLRKEDGAPEPQQARPEPKQGQQLLSEDDMQRYVDAI